MLPQRAELTAELVEVCLDFPPGVEEHSALFCADGDHAVLVYGDARHLSVQLGHRHALQERHTSIIHCEEGVWGQKHRVLFMFKGGLSLIGPQTKMNETTDCESWSKTYHWVQRRHQAGEDFLSGRHQRDLRLATGVGPDAITCQLPHLSHASAGTPPAQLSRAATEP